MSMFIFFCKAISTHSLPTNFYHNADLLTEILTTKRVVLFKVFPIYHTYHVMKFSIDLTDSKVKIRIMVCIKLL